MRTKLLAGAALLIGCVGGSLLLGLDAVSGMDGTEGNQAGGLLQMASADMDRGGSGASGARFGDKGMAREQNQARSRHGVEPVTHEPYVKECGSCHFAYQPGLLPARSWEKMLSGLDNHFGENAILDAPTRTDLTNYLTTRAADRTNDARSVKIMRSMRPEETPLRITETRYFTRQHHEIPRQVWADNPEVKSMIRCEACHPDAAKGSYHERAVRIPGHGRWKD
ncbi:MAG: diheme cytochrome c [Magnetococcales bacterium]|nr:diheme cytochrome c [Magnetococcales bacterium]